MDANQTHAMSVVRRDDPDRYLATLYAPQDRRAALFALHAFNAEIARVRDMVSEPLPGEIRLQWWRDVIAAGEPTTGNPLADALIGAIAAHDLPVATFDNYLEARVFDLYDDPMPNRTALEGYCGETASAMIQLAAMILDREAARGHAALAGHAGCAQAITGLLMATPRLRGRGQCYVPAEILAAAGLDREAWLAGENGEAMRLVVEAMRAVAREHLAAFEAGAAAIPPGLRAAFLPLALTGAHLSSIDAGTVHQRSKGDLSPLRRQWLLMRRALSGW